MDISGVVVAIVLITLFVGSVIWMEIHSRRTSSNDLRGASKLAPNKVQIPKQR